MKASMTDRKGITVSRRYRWLLVAAVVVVVTAVTAAILMPTKPSALDGEFRASVTPGTSQVAQSIWHELKPEERLLWKTIGAAKASWGDTGLEYRRDGCSLIVIALHPLEWQLSAASEPFNMGWNSHAIKVIGDAHPEVLEAEAESSGRPIAGTMLSLPLSTAKDDEVTSVTILFNVPDLARTEDLAMNVAITCPDGLEAYGPLKYSGPLS